MTSKVKISSLAKHILDQDENEYWRPESKTNCIEVLAYDFGDEGYQLAGPFKLDNRVGEYALVYVYRFPNCESLEKSLANVRHSMHHPVTTTYMPYASRRILEELYPGGVEFLYDRHNKKSYSEIDFPFMSKDLSIRVERTGDRCQVFANTPEGEELLISKMVESDISVWKDNISKAYDHIAEEMTKASAYKERPYVVRVQGTDDSSWSLNASSYKEVQAILKNIRCERMNYVIENMCFTN